MKTIVILAIFLLQFPVMGYGQHNSEVKVTTFYDKSTFTLKIELLNVSDKLVIIVNQSPFELKSDSFLHVGGTCNGKAGSFYFALANDEEGGMLNRFIKLQPQEKMICIFKETIKSFNAFTDKFAELNLKYGIDDKEDGPTLGWYSETIRLND